VAALSGAATSSKGTLSAKAASALASKLEGLLAPGEVQARLDAYARGAWDALGPTYLQASAGARAPWGARAGGGGREGRCAGRHRQAAAAGPCAFARGPRPSGPRRFVPRPCPTQPALYEPALFA
jgi:hypothetical protein